MLKTNAFGQPLPALAAGSVCSDLARYVADATVVPCDCLSGGDFEMADDNIQRLTRIEAGQGFLCDSMKELQWSMKELQLAMLKVAAQEERQVQLRIEVDALWKTVDKVKECQSRCPIESLKTQVGLIWVFLSGLALGLSMMFITRITP